MCEGWTEELFTCEIEECIMTLRWDMMDEERSKKEEKEEDTA